MSGFDINSLPGGLAYVKGSPVVADAAAIAPVFEQDGNGTGVSTKRTVLVSAARRLAVGLATKLFDYQFNATAQNTGIFRCLWTTMTATQTTGALTLNANSTLTTTTGVGLQTWRYFNFPGTGTVQIDIETIFTAAALANQLVILGTFPLVSATATPTDGVYFRYSTAGLIGCVNFNGVETQTGVLTFPAVAGTSYTLRMDISNSGVDFWVDDNLVGTIPCPAGNGTPMAWAALPISIQMLNPGTVSGSPVMQTKICNLVVTQRDMATEKLWELQQAGLGLMSSQGSEGNTMGSTALMTNNLAAGAGVAMTNTNPSLGSGLGGQFSAQPTFSVAADGIVWSYLNPAGSVNIIPRTLYIKSIWIQGLVTTAFTGGPVLYAYSLAYGHTAQSLATAETGSFVTSTAKAPRRIPLGFETYIVTSPVGTLGQGVMVTFTAPIAINPGENVALCAKNLGTVTTGGVITFLSRVDAFNE